MTGPMGATGRREKFLFCDVCKTKKFWLPKKSTSWRCWKCKPPSTSAIVAQIVGDDDVASPVESTPQILSTVPKLCAWIVCYERPACPQCKSALIEEVAREFGVEIRCWTCRKQFKDAGELLNEDEIEIEVDPNKKKFFGSLAKRKIS